MIWTARWPSKYPVSVYRVVVVVVQKAGNTWYVVDISMPQDMEECHTSWCFCAINRTAEKTKHFVRFSTEMCYVKSAVDNNHVRLMY